MENFKKTIVKHIFFNLVIVALAIFVFNQVSYSLNGESNIDNKDVLVETGNMQVILSVPKERYEFINTLKLGISDEMGKRQDGYTFTIKNVGNIPIEFYEVKLVDEENKVSTLPHQYLRFTIKKDNEPYSEVKNIGDVNNIIYEGENLGVQENSTFNFKMWIDNSVTDINNKTLFSALEVTLYQKKDILDSYISYISEEGENIPFRTSIYSPISSTIPKRDGYIFLGWSTVVNGMVKYHPGDTYQEKKGGTLYAIWEKKTND